jgi:hypothetical protein
MKIDMNIDFPAAAPALSRKSATGEHIHGQGVSYHDFSVSVLNSFVPFDLVTSSLSVE